MKKQNSTLVTGLTFWALPGMVLGFFISSCTIYKEGALINRTALQEVRANSPANQSEIREITFNNHANLYGYKDLHINGQLFIKTAVNGNTQISPCAGCAVMLTMPSDSSVRVNMTTEKDGYFSFHGQATMYSIFINNSGFNQMKIDNLSFETGGITTFKIINASGSEVEHFSVLKNGPDYTWSKIQ